MKKNGHEHEPPHGHEHEQPPHEHGHEPTHEHGHERRVHETEALETVTTELEMRVGAALETVAIARAEIAQLQEAIQRSEAEIPDLRRRARTSEDEIHRLQDRATANESKIEALQSRATADETKIANLTTQVNTAQGAISNLQATASRLVTYLDNTQAAPIVPPPPPPVIDLLPLPAKDQNGKIQVSVIGKGFAPTTDPKKPQEVCIVITCDDAPRQEFRGHTSATGVLIDSTITFTKQQSHTYHVAATDERTNPADWTGKLWSNSVTFVL